MSATDERETSAIREAAADWVVQLQSEDLTPADNANFTEWLRRSPAHVKEYLDAEAAWQAMAGAAREDSTPVVEVMREASGRVWDLPVGRPRSVGAQGHSRGARLGDRRIAWAIAAGLVLTVGLVGLFGVVNPLHPNSYSTGVGQTRRVMLADGSTLELNTQSRAHVRMSGSAREVFLDAGEAFFKVAKDPSRPFKVISDTAVVRAVGTQFDVYRQPQQTVVTVLEGRVAISKPAAMASQSGSLELSAGHRVAVGVSRVSSTEEGSSARDLNRVVAWREGRLIFDNEPLARVAAEFNRYNTRQLIVHDALLASERVSGVFKANRPDALVDFLRQNSEIEVTEDPDGRVMLGRL